MSRFLAWRAVPTTEPHLAWHVYEFGMINRIYGITAQKLEVRQRNNRLNKMRTLRKSIKIKKNSRLREDNWGSPTFKRLIHREYWEWTDEWEENDNNICPEPHRL